MRSTLLNLVLLIFSVSLKAQSLVTAEIFHGNDAQSTASVTSDFENNLLCLTGFWDDLDADPGPAVLNFNSAGSQDVAITKLDPAGNLLWSKQLSGSGFSTGQVIKSDAAGNVFVFGYFNGTMDMNPGPGTTNLVSAGSDDIYCGKYDPNGNLLWAARIGGTGTEQSYGFDLSSSGEAVVLGYFQNTVDFDPGAGTSNLTAGFSGSNFLLKLNNDGTFNNVLQMASAYGNAMIIDTDDNIFITGLFWETVDFNPGPGVNNLTAAGFSADAFVLKLNSDNIYQWAVKISGNGSEQGTALAYNAAENTIIVGGFFDGTIDINPGPAIENIASLDYVDGFISKLNAADGSFIWGKGIGGTSFQAIYGIGVNTNGNIWIAGYFENTVDCDPGPAIQNISSNGFTDIMIINWDTDANYIGAEHIGGNNSDYVSCLHIDDEGAVIISGIFEGVVDFDPGDVTFNLNSAFTGWDGYVAKYCTVYTIHNNVNICEGESYFAAGEFQTESGDYYDYFTPVEGCDSIIITHLLINDPVVDLGANYAICNGTTTTLNALNPGASYVWNTGALTQTINVTSAGIYSVTITDAAGCIATDAITITVNAAPNVNLGADINACSGETITLSAGNPGSTYLWSTGATTQTINVTATDNYSVVVTNGLLCTDNDIIHVNFDPLPIVNLGPTIHFCEGETIILDAENIGASYLWNTGAITQTLTTSIAGTYSVEVTNAFGCMNEDAVTLIQHNAPVVDLGDDFTVCADEIVVLNAGNPAADFIWNTGELTQTITVTESGTYSVMVTNAFGCSESDLISVIINPLPEINLGTTIEFCENTNVLLDAENIGSSYLWNTGAVTQTITTAFPGTYTVTVINDEGCSAQDEVTLIDLPSPVIELGADTGFCEGTEFVLDATTPDVFYLWNTGAETPSITATTEGEYFVTITNFSGCFVSDTINLITYSSPVVDLGADNSFCLDEEIILDATNPLSNYLWSTGDTTATITIIISGDYSVSVINNYGCSAEDEISISLLPLPVADLGADSSGCQNEGILLDATTPMCTYEWNTGATTPIIYVTESGLYTVHITNSFGCDIIDSINILLLPAPDVNLSLPFITVCSNAAPLLLSGGTPDGGNYLGEGISDGVFDVAGLSPGTYQINYVYADINGCSDTAEQNITLTICQDISDVINAEINIYPNPAINDLIIQNNSGVNIENLAIYSMQGEMIYIQNVSIKPLTKYNLPISNIPSGTYMINLNNMFYKPVIIQH